MIAPSLSRTARATLWSAGVIGRFAQAGALVLALVLIGAMPAQAQDGQGNVDIGPLANTDPPVLSVNRTPTTMVAGQSYNVRWTTNATALEYSCTASGTGYNGGGAVPVSLPAGISGTADPLWVNYPSTCVWEASNAYGVTFVTEYMTTVASSPAPTMTAASVSPSTLVAGQNFVFNWSSANATSVRFVCTAGGTGFVTPAPYIEVGPNGPSGPLTADALWVGNPSSCSFTAVGPGGSSAPFPVTMTTVASPPALALSPCSSATPSTAPTPATTTCTVQNTGGTAVSSISYSSIAGLTVGGPTGACAANSTCGALLVSTGTTAGGPYTGTLTATPNTGSAAQVAISLTVNPPVATPAALSLTLCNTFSPSTAPTPATTSCTVQNTGGTAVSSISYSSIAGLSISGPTGACAANSTCGTLLVSTGTTAGGPYTGTLTATPNTGSAASVAISLTVNPPPVTPAALSLSPCSSATPSTAPTPATTSCTVQNTGGTAVSSISYSSIAGLTVGGPTGACAANSTCGTLLVSTGTTAGGPYTGTLTATPNTGSAAQVAISLTVNPAVTGAVLALSPCSSVTPSIAPTPATTSCTVKNIGGTAVSSISYSSIAGLSVSGPTGACAANSTCGTLLVSTGTTAGGPYTGTLTATPNTGSAAQVAISLTVNPAAAGGEVVTYVHTDGLGSPVAKTNASGVRISLSKYEAYGMTLIGSDTPTVGFTGHFHDADTGLTYMQQRYYDPVAGRFMSEDPVLTDANTGSSFNRYAYANNNPFKFIDPDGREPYLVSRPLSNSVAGTFAVHNFIVTHAFFVGDPSATVYSYGSQSNGVTGRVGDNTRGVSAPTSKSDYEYWKSLSKSDEAAKTMTTKINASDQTVAEVAGSVDASTNRYSFVPDLTTSATNKANSNSVASAVANRSQGSEVSLPNAGGRYSPGAAQSDRVRFTQPKQSD